MVCNPCYVDLIEVLQDDDDNREYLRFLDNCEIAKQTVSLVMMVIAMKMVEPGELDEFLETDVEKVLRAKQDEVTESAHAIEKIQIKLSRRFIKEYLPYFGQEVGEFE